MLNFYKVTQYFEDGEDFWEVDSVIVRCEDEGEALRIAFEDDTVEPRRFGWLDATAEMVAWATGDNLSKGILGFV
jgi:hypothetical protein